MRDIEAERARERESTSLAATTPSMRSAMKVAEIQNQTPASAFEITTWKNRPPDDADGSAPILIA